MAKKTETPIYMKVAVDVAKRIVSEDIKVGEKLLGRTTLASEYQVSPETIRKAMGLLEDVSIVEVRHGSGIYVISARSAEAFIERHRIQVNVNEQKEALIDLMKQRDLIESHMNAAMNAIVDYSSRFKNTEYIMIHEYALHFRNEECLENQEISYSLEELKIKEKTGATVVGIKRKSELLVSPPDTERLHKGDHLLYVGDEQASMRLGEYLRNCYMNIK